MLLKSLVQVLNLNTNSFYRFTSQNILIPLKARIIMNRIYHLIFIAFLFLLFLSCTPTKELGKLYSKEEANKLFGNVIYSVDLNTDLLSGLLKKTEHSVMFGFIDRQLIILDNNRKLIYPEKAEYSEKDVFTVYSTDVVMKLLSSKELNKDAGSDPEAVSVEQRREVLSVSTETSTLETGSKCPPFCPAD